MNDIERKALWEKASEDERKVIESLYDRQNSYYLKTQDISKDTGISTTQILRFCQGRAGMGLSSLCRLAREFGYKVTLVDAIDDSLDDICDEGELMNDLTVKQVKGTNDISEDLDSTIKKAYENLANAIVVTACDDWKEASASKNGIANVHGKTFSVDKIEKFFKSDWFKCLTQVDGTYILRRLKQEV